MPRSSFLFIDRPGAGIAVACAGAALCFASTTWAASPGAPDTLDMNLTETLCPHPEQADFDPGLENAAALTAEFYRLPPCGGRLRGVAMSGADPVAALRERANAPMNFTLNTPSGSALDLSLERLAELGRDLRARLPAPLGTLDAPQLIEQLLAGAPSPEATGTLPGSGALGGDLPGILQQLETAPELQDALIGFLLIEALITEALPGEPQALAALIFDSLPGDESAALPSEIDPAALTLQALSGTLRDLIISGLALLAGVVPQGTASGLPLTDLQLDDIARLGLLDLLAASPDGTPNLDGLANDLPPADPPAITPPGLEGASAALEAIRALLGVPAASGQLPDLAELSALGLFGLVEALAAPGAPSDPATLVARLAALLDTALGPLAEGLPLADLLQTRVAGLLARVTSAGTDALSGTDLPLLGLALAVVDPARLGDSPFAAGANQVQAAADELFGAALEELLARSLSDLQADGLERLVSALGGDPSQALPALGGDVPALPAALADLEVQQLILLGLTGLRAPIAGVLDGTLPAVPDANDTLEGGPGGLDAVLADDLANDLATNPAALGLGIIGRLLALNGVLGDGFRDLLDGITQAAPGQLADLTPADLQALDLLNLALLGLDGAPAPGVSGDAFSAPLASLLDFISRPGDAPLVVVNAAGANSVLVIDLPGIDPPAPAVGLDLLQPGGLLGLDVLGFDTLDVALLRLGLLGQPLLDQPLLDLGEMPTIAAGTPLVTAGLRDTRILAVSVPGLRTPVPLLDLDLLQGNLAAVDVLGLDVLDLGILRLALLGQDLQGLGSLADGLALLDLGVNPLASAGAGHAPLVNLSALDVSLVQVLPHYRVDQPLVDVALLGQQPLTVSLDGQELLRVRLLGLALLGRDLLGTGSLSEATALLTPNLPGSADGGPLVNVGALNGELLKLFIPNRGFENPLLDVDLLGDSLLSVDLAGRELLQLRLLGLALLGRELLTPNGLFSDAGLLQAAGNLGNLAGPDLALIDSPLGGKLLPGHLALPAALGSVLQLDLLDGGLLGGSGILGTAIGDGIVGNGLLP